MYTRCKEDLCNDTDGTRATVEGGGVIVVDGVDEDYDWAKQTYGLCDENDEDCDVSGANASDVSFFAIVLAGLMVFMRN